MDKGEQPMGVRHCCASFSPGAIFVATALTWTVLALLSFMLNFTSQRRQIHTVAMTEARAYFSKDLALRRWITLHGGVYVPRSPSTPPNPFLSHVPERNLRTSSGRELTLMNPAAVIRQMAELGYQADGVVTHIANLAPRRPENAPDPWERRALVAIKGGVDEFWETTRFQNHDFLRLTRPLTVVEGCLKCHEDQGYLVGQILGGLTVSIPMAPLYAINARTMATIAGAHLVLWLLGILAIHAGARQLASVRRRWEHTRDTLAASEQRFRMLADFTYAWEEWVAPDNTLSYVSPSCERISGYPTEAFYRDPELFQRIVHERDREPFIRHARAHLQAQAKEEILQFRIITRKGEERWINHVCRSVFGPGGEWLGRRVTNRDITEQQRFQGALLAERQLFIAGPTVVFTRLLALDAPPSYVSPNVTVHFGYSPEDFLSGRLWLFDLIHPDDRGQVKERLRRKQEGRDEHYEQEYRLRNADGEYRWVQEFSVVTRDADGEVGGCHSYLMDCTARKIADQVIESSRRRLDLVVKSADLGTWIWEEDAAGAMVGEQWPSVSASGFNASRSQGGTWRDRVHPDDLPEFERLFYVHLAGRTEQFVAEHRLRTPDGGWRWVLTSGQVIRRDEQGRAVAALGIHLDINDRKEAEQERLRLERQLMQARKFESLHVMAGSIAHNFNNMLMGVMGNVELAKLLLGQGKDACTFLDLAIKAAKQAAGMSQRMLTYVGQSPLRARTVDLAALLPEMIALLRSGIPDRIALTCASGVDALQVKLDATMLQQVLMNLVTNAHEAIGENEGAIRVDLDLRRRGRDEFQPPFDHDGLEGGDYACITVEDNGCGMDKETRDRIFDPFFTTKFTGRGLGMAAVLGIVRGHQGAMDVDSEPGRGTTVRVLLPLQQVAEEKETQIETEKTMESDGCSALRGKIVLLADDDEMLRDIGGSMLEQLGCEVILAVNGEEAVARFTERREAIDLVILDMDMPDRSGLEVSRELRRLVPGITVIIASGYPSETILAKAAGEAPAAVLEKPFRFHELETVLRRVMAGWAG